MVSDPEVNRLNRIRVARAQGVDPKVVDRGALLLISKNIERFLELIICNIAFIFQEWVRQ
jgi:hypothetical protein